jgi:hypothetical protein
MSPTMWGALKYTAKMLGLRKPHDAVDPQFTRPQGFYDPNDVDLKKLRRLIKHGKLAPCYPGREVADDEETEARLDAAPAKGGDETSTGDVHLSAETNAWEADATSKDASVEKDGRARDHVRLARRDGEKPSRGEKSPPRALDECPICFLCYPCLNKSRCCSSEICTECYLRVRAPSNAPEEYDRAGRRLMRPPKCPFCKTEGYGVSFGGAKSDADRAAEAEERAALAKALEAARAAELAEQTERRARRASVEAQRRGDARGHTSSASAPGTPATPTLLAGAPPGPGQDSSLPSSPVPVGWEEEYAAMTPTAPAELSPARSRSIIDSVSSSSFGDGRTRAPARDRDPEEEARRRAARRRDRHEFSASRDFFAASSSRRGERRAFLPAGSAFLPRNNRNPELFTADHGYRGHGFGLGRRGGPASGAALARERESETRRTVRHAADAHEERSNRDERLVLRELARRAESRRERRRQVAELDASRGETSGDEAFLARVRDFIPERLLEESFGDLGGGDVDGEEALDIAASRALDIDDVMMMEAVYLSLQEQEQANRRRASPSGERADLAEEARAAAEAAEAAEVEEAIALVAAAEAAEAAERAGRSLSATTATTARGEAASREATEDAEEGGETRNSSGDLEVEREGGGGREAPEEVSVVDEVDPVVDEAGLTGDEAEAGDIDAFDAVNESLAALEAEAARITAHRLSSLGSRPATPPAAGREAAPAEALEDAEHGFPHAPVPDADDTDDTMYMDPVLEASAFEAEPVAEAARAVADPAGAPRDGEGDAPEESEETAPEPEARGPETPPPAPGAGAGARAVTVAETTDGANANVEHAPENEVPLDLPDVPTMREEEPSRAS